METQMKLIPAGDFELQTTFFWIKPTLRAFSRVLNEFNMRHGGQRALPKPINLNISIKYGSGNMNVEERE